MKTYHWGARLALAACAVLTPIAQASQVTLSGSTFDISFDDAAIGLFGTPTLVGNTLSWFPAGSPGFSALASNSFDLTNSTFAMRVTAKPGYVLSSFSLQEAGDYLYFGGRTGVAVSGQLRVTPLPGSTLIDAIDATGLGIRNSPLDFTTRNWQAAASVTVGGNVTLANVSIENLLVAYALYGESLAFIEKKEVMLDIVTSPIPEPGTLGLLLAGVAVVGAVARRRRA